MINMQIFGRWDLTFGSGFQTFGALVAVVTFTWFLKRSEALVQLMAGASDEGKEPSLGTRALFFWMRWVVPTALLTLGVWWLLTQVLGVVE